jgi:hypothetical protein
MDAKVHPDHRHWDAEEMICPVRRDLRQKAAVASADQGVDRPDVAVHRNFRESSPAPVRGFHRLALADAEAYSVELQTHLTLPLVADRSAGRGLGVRTVLAAKVVGHLDRVHPVWERQKEVQLGVAMAHRIAALRDAEPRELAWLKSPPEQEPLAQLELPREPERQASPPQAQE